MDSCKINHINCDLFHSRCTSGGGVCYCDEVGESRENIICNNVVFFDKMNFWDLSLGTNGAFYLVAENGIDIKVASIEEEYSVIISNNYPTGLSSTKH